MLFGLAPALRLSRLNVNATLKDGGRGVTGGRSTRLSGILVSAEIALAVVLLAGAGVMMRSFLNVSAADVGAKTSNVVTLSLALPEVRYARPESQIAFFEQVTTRLARPAWRGLGGHRLAPADERRDKALVRACERDAG